MRRLARLTLLAAAVACALLAAGCGNRTDEIRTLGETEGVYLDIDELKYQVQLSRYLNASDPEDRSYLAGLPADTEQPAGDETWFGVFLLVSNETDATHAPADDFEIVDTQENAFRPVPLDPAENPFAYQPRPIPPGGTIPVPNSPAAQGVVQGSLLLFKVTTSALQNRPLEFKFRGGSGTTGIVDLDV
jgi:hypothetical protein